MTHGKKHQGSWFVGHAGHGSKAWWVTWVMGHRTSLSRWHDAQRTCNDVSIYSITAPSATSKAIRRKL